MEDNNVGILVDAKEEYTKQLISILKPSIYQGIKSIYIDAKDICHQDNTPDNVLMSFQDLLSRIPKWSQDIINKEFERISNISKCDYIDDLIKVIYVSHIKILSVVHSSQKNKKLSLNLPSGSYFIHLCYIECAREFWKDPYLLSDRGTKFEQQKNMRDSENMIINCIGETIRKQLPVRNILKDFLNEVDEDINEEDAIDIKDPVNKKYLKKLETIVKKELKTNTTNTMGNSFDIDLIRQVIREEIEARPSTNTIKKEIVDTVVEKIVEKSNDTTEDSIETFDNDIKKDVKNDIKKDVKKEVKIKENTEIIPEITNETQNKTETIINELDIKNRDDINNIEESNENINSSLGTILNEIKDVSESESKDISETKDVSETKDLSETKDVSEVNNNNDDNDDDDYDNDNDKDISNKLSINNIDEVNLNLDELDLNECEEINIDDLNQVELNNNNNEVSKSKDTKFIFFDDTKS